PIATWGAIGADVSYVYMGDMVRTLESPTEGYEEDGTFNYSDMSGRIAFSGKFMEDILLGGSIQILQSNVRFDGVTKKRVGDRKAQSTAINLGCIYNTPIPNLTAGASLRNMGNQTKAFFDEEESLPFSFRLGASYRTLVSKPEDQPIVEDEEISSPEEVFGKLPNALLLAVDLHFPADNSFGLRMGGEYRFSNGIAVRGGYRTGTGLEFPYGLCGGAGYKTESYQIDYAIVPYGDIGSTHRFSLTIVF
ncbi:PorV/PorQ family protein, partial [Candidatus Poribacteria bacterium]|nr:PorV/PorQ family protein [Candidatus Poribacteria bacterium]